mgnify:CR=1 FL=1
MDLAGAAPFWCILAYVVDTCGVLSYSTLNPYFWSYLFVRVRVCIVNFVVFCKMTAQSTKSTLFPYTTLFRSELFNSIDDERFSHRRDWAIKFGNEVRADRKSTRLNSSHITKSYAVFCSKKKKNQLHSTEIGTTHWEKTQAYQQQYNRQIATTSGRTDKQDLMVTCTTFS